MTASLWLALAVLGTLLVSGVLAMLRGFVRELLGIGAWIGAAVAAFAFYPRLAPTQHGLLDPGLVSDLAAGGAIFVVVVIVLSLLARLLANRVQDSAAGSIDRTLGFIFGLARGAALVCFAYIALAFFGGDRERWPDWLRGAQSLRFAEPGAAWIVAQLPPGMLPPPASTGSRRPSIEQLLRPAPSRPGDRSEGYRPEERRDLDRLLNTAR